VSLYFYLILYTPLGRSLARRQGARLTGGAVDPPVLLQRAVALAQGEGEGSTERSLVPVGGHNRHLAALVGAHHHAVVQQLGQVVVDVPQVDQDGAGGRGRGLP